LICGDVKQSQQDKLFENIEIYGQKPFNKRVIFIDVDSYSNNFNKTCIEEAEVTKVLLENLSNKIENIEEDTFGIITPFRAQISVIRNEIRHLPFYDKLQIDTIERYQGSEKQIIIISFGVSYKTQLKSITSFNNSGTLDRKLNVAISRAKDYLVLVGNQKILELHPHLKELINEIKLKNSYIKLNDFGI
jgi:DNA replication ATP-dependent helicase Dna2